MNEASSSPQDGKSGIGKTITTALRQPSFLRVMLLLAALVVVQAFAGDRALELDARAAGLAVGAVLVVLRAPFLLVVVAAAATAALLRLV